MKKYAKIVVRNNSIYTDNLFTYEVPDLFMDIIEVGHRVLIPFGMTNKPIEGFIFNLSNEFEENIKTKKIIDILDKDPMIKLDDIELINWMRNRYLCTYLDCINLIYPKGYKVENYKVVNIISDDLKDLNKSEKEIIGQILKSNNKIKLDKIKAKNKTTLNNILHKLKNENIIEISWEYKSNKNEKKINLISLRYKEHTHEYIKENKIKLGLKQQQIVEFLKIHKVVELNELLKLTESSRSSINSLDDKKIINIIEEDYYRKPESIYKIQSKSIELNYEQQYVSDTICNNMFNEEKKPYMIHGVTGSGKTEVYLEIIDKAIKEGLDAVVLVPEISLTPQTISRFKNKFGDIVGVFHSQLSDGERHDVYRLIKDGSIRILVGARSALFAPFNNLGVIVIDEFHEGAYKSDKNPKYSAIEVAKFIANQRDCTLVVGSATPSIDEYYKAKNNEYELIEINTRANKKPMPKIDVVDMKEELSDGNRSIFSAKLQNEIRKTLDSNNQVILFLNRRGYANFVSCRNCSFVFTCSNCDISLTYHKKENSGRCHYCGYEIPIPTECPECKSNYIKPFGAGTQKIEEEIKNLFIDAKILRIDKDTTSKKGSIEEILDKFKNQEANILIGTQMISKGLDFENVTLVGILSADMILKFPDFRSSETTFQLITQVAGRAGRAEAEGKVILQTYDTDHYAIKHAINYDYRYFYEDEIKIRKIFNYTPFNNILSVVVSGSNEKQVINNSKKLYDSILYLLKKRGFENFDFILGPNPCPIAKINQNHRWQILFKDDYIEINLLKGIIKYICISKREVVFDKDVNISIDINPYSIL